jgi:cysteinyl-tRNA synthetase
MESFSGKTFANYFLHGEHLIVDGVPMSKSRGNILYPDDLVNKGYEHKHLRFFLTYTYYRKKLNFTNKNFTKASEILDSFRARLREIMENQGGGKNDRVGTLVDSIQDVFEKYMDDDLHLGDAFDAVYDVLGEIQKALEGNSIQKTQAKELEKRLKAIDEVFGVIF